MGCHKALRRALRRAPVLAAEEMRRLDTDRCEEMYRSLTPSIEQGDSQAVRAAVQVLALKAGINGYKSSEMEARVSARAELVFSLKRGPDGEPIQRSDDHPYRGRYEDPRNRARRLPRNPGHRD